MLFNKLLFTMLIVMEQFENPIKMPNIFTSHFISEFLPNEFKDYSETNENEITTFNAHRIRNNTQRSFSKSFRTKNINLRHDLHINFSKQSLRQLHAIISCMS